MTTQLTLSYSNTRNLSTVTTFELSSGQLSQRASYQAFNCHNVRAIERSTVTTFELSSVQLSQRSIYRAFECHNVRSIERSTVTPFELSSVIQVTGSRLH